MSANDDDVRYEHIFDEALKRPCIKGLRMDLIQSILEIDMPQSIDIQGDSAIYNFGDETKPSHKRAYISCLFLQKSSYFLKVPRDSCRKRLVYPVIRVSEKSCRTLESPVGQGFEGHHFENVPNQISLFAL